MIKEFLNQDRLLSLVRAGAILVFGLIVARMVAGAVGRMAGRYMGDQQRVLFRKMAFYMLVCIVAASVLRELGFKLSVLLGAAGVLTVAVGFAAQTSASNIISGLFLLADKPFQIGDVVSIGGTVGVVEAVELISTKLRTFQNHLVRIPNEEVNKSQVENMTYWPIRRVDIEIGVAYKEDIENVREALMTVADSQPLCLQEPAPLLIFKGYGDSALEFLFCVWTARENFLGVMNGVKQGIKEEFDRRGIEIPFPHLSIYAGSVTGPIPVRMCGPEQPQQRA
jgi:small-conductance mechanosensitive channel